MMVNEYVYSPHYDFYINKIHREQGYEMKMFHLHKKYEIYYQIEGTRKYFIEDSVYLANAGSLVLIDKDEIHKTSSIDDSPHTRIVLNFNMEYINKLSCIIDPQRLVSFFSEGVKVVIPPFKEKVLIENILERLVELDHDPEEESEPLRQLLLGELLIYIKYCVELQTANNKPQKISTAVVDEISQFITQHYTENLTLSQIAKNFYISTFYLSHLFKKTTNLSVGEYINSVRIRAAKNLLESTNLKITEIAEQAGFPNSSHFSRTFHTGTGLSPIQYRKFYHNK